MNREAIYAASFDPFTTGHLQVLEKAARMYDHVYIILAHNADKKKRRTDKKMMLQLIEESTSHIPNITVVEFGGVVAKWAKERNIKYTVRGLRSTDDFKYERKLENFNLAINPELETVYLCASSFNKSSGKVELNDVSSSDVAIMYSLNEPIAVYVPYDPRRIMWNKDN